MALDAGDGLQHLDARGTPSILLPSSFSSGFADLTRAVGLVSAARPSQWKETIAMDGPSLCSTRQDSGQIQDQAHRPWRRERPDAGRLRILTAAPPPAHTTKGLHHRDACSSLRPFLVLSFLSFLVMMQIPLLLHHCNSSWQQSFIYSYASIRNSQIWQPFHLFSSKVKLQSLWSAHLQPQQHPLLRLQPVSSAATTAPLHAFILPRSADATRGDVAAVAPSSRGRYSPCARQHPLAGGKHILAAS